MDFCAILNENVEKFVKMEKNRALEFKKKLMECLKL